MSNRSAIAEVMALSNKSKRPLKPQSLVDHARDNPGTALHAYFQWDDVRAGNLHRLEQARSLLRHIRIDLPEVADPVRVFVSVSTDRQKGGGYRKTADVIRSPTLNQQMLKDALDDANRFRRKWSHVSQLAKVHAAIDSAIEEFADQIERPRKESNTRGSTARNSTRQSRRSGA